MKNQNDSIRNFRLDLIALILLIVLLAASIVNAQDDLKKGIKIFEKKNYYGAKKYFNDYLETNPEKAQAHYYLGRIAMEERELKQAIVYFDKAIDIDNNNSEYFTWKGIANIELLSTVNFMEQGVYAMEALQALETAIHIDPENVDARMWLAGYYSEAPDFAGGSKEKTKEQYEAIIKINPAFVPAYINYGNALIKFEEFDLALENLEKSLKYDPENYSAYFYLGKMSAESGKYSSKGEKALKKFIESAPKEFKDSKDEAWWFLGRIYSQDGDSENARKAYEKAIALDPEKEDYRKSLKKLM